LTESVFFAIIHKKFIFASVKGFGAVSLRNNPSVRYPTPWDSYATLPLSIPLSEALVKTKITPNQVTILSFIVALFAIPCFIVGTYPYLLLAAIIYQFSYILDCVDGYIARKKGMRSGFGYWLDHVLDEVKLALLLIALIYGQITGVGFAHHHPNLVWIAGFAYLYSRVFGKGDLLIKSGIENEKIGSGVIPAPDIIDEAKYPNGMILTPMQMKLWEKFMITTPFSVCESQAILFVLGPLFNVPIAGLIAAAFLALLWHFVIDVWRFWRKEFAMAKRTAG